MAQKSDLAQWLSLLGQVFLRDDPRALILPEDEPPESFRLLLDEIRLSQADPEPAHREYVRLFLSPQGAACPPWQSVHSAAAGEPPRLFGPAHHSALEWYRNYGAAPSAESEPADHLGLLLLFYARLVFSGAGQETLGDFHEQHLAWAPVYLEKLSAEARHPLYRVLADVTRSIL